ncbi:MAG: C4-type zinc ribbon domain-containing protein [Verrucomicrobiales bacterium]|nr:C4-type zinc ribbon domain-containing protein [Verrucomicrobiales bacterium]
MLPELEKLIVIQHRDKNIVALEKQIANIPFEEEDIRDRISEERDAVAKALADFQEVEIAIKNIELDVQTRRDTITKLKVQQFQTKKNEEFRTMGEEIVRYEGEVAELEDKEIELMEKAEELNKVLEQAKEELSDSEDSVETDIGALHQTKGNWEKELAAEKAARAKIAADVDEDLLASYKRTFDSKNGTAVVGLVDSQCSGCHMKVTKSTMVNVKSEKEITYCENCGRMLYWWTDDSEAKTSNEY